MRVFNINSAGIEFKNLLSGPAPVGRILNYLYVVGTTGLFHKNGYRRTDLSKQIGYAWTTEFMIGLGLIVVGGSVGDKYILQLSKTGKEIFDVINTGHLHSFDEGITPDSIAVVRNQMQMCSPDLYRVFLKAFSCSFPFAILKEFLDQNGYTYPRKNVFMDDLFETVKMQYDTNPTPYNRASRLPTGRNRVPSLLQLCQLFDLLTVSGNQLLFNQNAINKLAIGVISVYTPAQMAQAAKQAGDIIVDADLLAQKYGIDGTVLSEVIVRNSALQRMFRENLLVSQKSKCVLCNIKNKEMLNGSHIKPAAESNAFEKADQNNGLLLCCNHDRLFDRHLITFSSMDGQIELSKTISQMEGVELGLDINFKLPEELLTPERQQYLMDHNLKFNEKEASR